MGLWIGSLIGAMAQVVPYAFVLLAAAGLSALAWKQDGGFVILLMIFSLLIGSLFGNMGSIMPFGVTLYLGMIAIIMVWRTQGGSVKSGPTDIIGLILFVIVSVGIFFNGTNLDFCNPGLLGPNVCLNPGVSGLITAWHGCVNTCAISPVSFLGSSPFAFLITGDFIAFINSFFTAPQSPFTVSGIFNVLASLITFIVGSVLLILGTGIGVEATAATIGGRIQPNQQGTRIFQSLGVGLILWSTFTGLVLNTTSWFGYLGFGLGAVGASSTIYIVFVSLFTYELYEQARLWSA